MQILDARNAVLDQGTLSGGVRQHEVVVNRLEADAFRSASQSQQGDVNATAFSGGNSDPDLRQDEDLNQTAVARNFRFITISPVTSTNANAGAFDNNYLQEYIANADAQDLLSRGASQIAQS
jgi:hypothetical protein